MSEAIVKLKLVLLVTILVGILVGVSGCGFTPKHLRPLSYATMKQLTSYGADQYTPILFRIFKEESIMEVWKQRRSSGRYVKIKSYQICRWSGRLGPKLYEGDRQTPEGFYSITPAQMFPQSQNYLAFNIGYPNEFDVANGRTGSFIMVHGGCRSAGCYAISDKQMQEVYSLARDAFRGGQRAFQLQAYPFKMTARNIARHWNNPNMGFWLTLKEGYDNFGLTKRSPKVGVCSAAYVFNAHPVDGQLGFDDPNTPCPKLTVSEPLRRALAAKAMSDRIMVTKIMATKGVNSALAYNATSAMLSTSWQRLNDEFDLADGYGNDGDEGQINTQRQAALNVKRQVGE